ncbi:Protein PLANT CADMIUM RESISTANCE 10 [Bienertia sinuspersici]
MKEQGSYVPPPYVPLEQSDKEEPEAVTAGNNNVRALIPISEGSGQWSSGICACCDDTPSCFVGLVCPCYLFAKNAEFLGSGTLQDLV